MRKLDDLLNSAQAEELLGKVVNIVDRLDKANVNRLAETLGLAWSHWLGKRSLRRGIVALNRWTQGAELSSKEIRHLVDAFAWVIYFVKIYLLVGEHRGAKLITLLDSSNSANTSTGAQAKAQQAFFDWAQKYGI